MSKKIGIQEEEEEDEEEEEKRRKNDPKITFKNLARVSHPIDSAYGPIRSRGGAWRVLIGCCVPASPSAPMMNDVSTERG